MFLMIIVREMLRRQSEGETEREREKRKEQ